MKVLIALAVALVAVAASSAPDQPSKPLRVFIRASEKTHGPGEHDYPRFLQDWTALLNERGAVATGAPRFPTRAELDRTDVVVLYASDGNNVAPADRKNLERFVRRGGGLVALHDAICGTNATWFKTVAGGAKEHGVTNWSRGLTGLYFQDYSHPITTGISNFDLQDESFYRLHLMPGIKVLASTFHGVKEIVPQIWTYESGRGRSFVCLPGHHYANFALPHFRGLLLRGIAWAGQRPVDTLLRPVELASFRYPEGGPTSPERAAEKIQVNREFNLSLVAAEPLVVKPISIDWDARGRLWVATTPEYPFKQDKGPARDAIIILEDTDGDGRMDRRKVFADGLNLITSFVFYRDGVIVAQAPQILFLRDTDDDGVVDRREVLFSGFGRSDTHAVMNNFRWGPDGWIYACQGESGAESTNIFNHQSRRFGRIGNGIFRFKPDGSVIEQVSAYSGNSWGIDFSIDGELFFTIANGPHINHVVMPERYLMRGRIGNATSYKAIEDHQKISPLFADSREEYVQVSPVGVFSAASGCTLYDGGAWPEKYHGSHFVCEPSVHVVHEDILSRLESPSFEATRRDDAEFIAASDLWFRPVHTRVGPDGAMYVLDFYNQAITHNDIRGVGHGKGNAALRPDRDHQNGRIWRVQHKMARSYSLPPLSLATSSELVKALEHPNGWVRRTAQRLLDERQDRTVVPQLVTLLNSNRLMHVRIHALWTLHLLNALTDANLVAALADNHPSVQNSALCVVPELRRAPSSNVIAGVLKQIKDTAERTRLLALLALTQWPPSKESISAAHKLFPDLKDDWTKSSLLAMARLSPTNFIRASFASDKPDSYRELVGPLVEDFVRDENQAAAGWILAHAARQAPGTDKLKITVLGIFAKHLAEFAPVSSTNLDAAIRNFLKTDNRALKVAAYPLVSHYDHRGTLATELASLRKGLLTDLDKDKMKDEDRNTLVSQVMQVEPMHPEVISRLDALLHKGPSKEVQKHIISELAKTSHPLVANTLIGNFDKLTTENKALALGTLLRRSEWSMELLSALNSKAIALTNLGVQGPSRLLNHPDAAVARRAGTVLTTLHATPARQKDRLIGQFQTALLKPADAKNGKELFEKNCAVCHKFRDKGKDIGPNLTGVGLQGESALLAHILDPNRVVEPKFVTHTVITKKDDEYTGLLKSENSDKVVLQNLEGENEIKQTDISSRRSSGQSLMPDGIENLGEKNLRDIVGFLAANIPRGFRPLDLTAAFTADSRKGLYEVQGPNPSLAFKQFGIVMVDNIPFNIANPATTPGGRNVVVLKGGSGFAQTLPQRVDFSVGTKATKLYVLGGVAGWGFPDGDPDAQDVPAAKARLEYADGKTEEIVWKNGEEFADYVRPYEVPGSRSAGDLLTTIGQVRWFAIVPKRPQVIKRIVLESFNNKLAPTFVAMTAQVE